MVQKILNAPGEPPSHKRVEKVIRKCLGIEENSSIPTPEYCIQPFTSFLTDYPGDSNFLLELPDPKDTSIGGNGFGLVTCMEDDCWCDTILSADPNIPDGGRSNGLGSFYEYAMHCREQRHVRCRDRRLETQETIIPPKGAATTYSPPLSPIHNSVTPSRAPMADLPSDFTNRPRSSQPSAGSSRHGLPIDSKASTKRSQPAVKSFLASSPAQRGSSDRSAVFLDDDDDDDDITFIGASEPKPSKRPSVVVIDDNGDSDDDIKPITSSQASRPPPPPWVTRWQSMSIADRLAAVTQELHALGALRPLSPEIRGAIQLRKSALRNIQRSCGIQQWTPPAQNVLSFLPDSAFHERLRDTIERPVVLESKPFAAVAGPSQPAGPGLSFLDALLEWRRLPSAIRLAASRQEQAFLTRVYGAFHRELALSPTIKSVLVERMVEAAKRCQTPDTAPWTPPSATLLHFCPGLRDVTVRELEKFFPIVPETEVESYGSNTPTPVVAGSSLQALVKPEQAVVKPELGAYSVAGGMPGAFPGPVLSGMPGAFPGQQGMFGPPGGIGMAGVNLAALDHVMTEWDRPRTQEGLAEFFKDALEDFKEDATIEDGLMALKLSSLDDLLPGANFKLLPHQVLGVAFMVKREERKKGRGGLLCDAMGLGKTVQTLGIMLARDERPQDFKKAPQLIVAPVALLSQWKAEIESKTTKNWKVHIHHGAGREKSAARLKQYDVVLTSYGTLRSEAFPNGRKKKKKSKSILSDGEDSEGEVSRKSPLLDIDWYRVILDEAHIVRNKSTSTAKAVLALECLHPWILTGTPVVNSLADLGPALKFIGAMDFEEFGSRVAKIEKSKPKLAAKRCQAILRPLIMRRNKESKINGVQILQLPPKTTNLASLDFEPEERAIYTALEMRAKVQVNKFIKEGTLMKNYSVVLVLLTRLRQCVNHPWLLRRKPGEEASPDDTLVVGDELFGGDITKCCDNDSDEYGRAIGLLGAPAVDIMKRKLEERYQRMTGDADDQEDQELECSICYEPFDGSELITPCQHIYCKTCLSNLFAQVPRDATALNDEQAAKGCRLCPLCRAVIEPGRVFRTQALFQPPSANPEEADEVADDLLQVDAKPNVQTDRKGKKRAAPGPIDNFFKKPKLDEDNKKADEIDEGEVEKDIPPSTKMRHLLQLVQGYLAEDKTTKVIVFSQFVSFLDLLQDFLNVAGVRNIGYRGSMSQNERNEAIRRFSMPSAISDSISVMLISTKAGGVGLNLTMASKVICCDLAWNPATENQAVDRAHRIGQSRPVAVERLVIKNTVEDRLLEIQEQKGLLADGAMGEGAVSRLGRLTLENIRMLFAMDREYEGED